MSCSRKGAQSHLGETRLHHPLEGSLSKDAWLLAELWNLRLVRRDLCCGRAWQHRGWPSANRRGGGWSCRRSCWGSQWDCGLQLLIPETFDTALRHWDNMLHVCVAVCVAILLLHCYMQGKMMRNGFEGAFCRLAADAIIGKSLNLANQAMSCCWHT